MVRAVLTGCLTGLGFDIVWFSSVSSKHLGILCHDSAIYVFNVLLHSSLYHLVSWTWCDQPLTWLTNHCPSVLCHCWLGRLVC